MTNKEVFNFNLPDGVIDVHTHSGSIDVYNFQIGHLPFSQSAKDLALKARMAGINLTVTFPFPTSGFYDARELVKGKRVLSNSQDFPYQLENQAVTAGCKKQGEKLLPFVCVDPSAMAKEQLDYLSKLYDQQRFFGLKLHTVAANSSATDLGKSGFVDFAKEHNLPILVHCDLVFPKSHSEYILQLAKDFPELRICMAHLAWLDDEAISQIPKYQNLFIDCSPFLDICKKVAEGNPRISKNHEIDPLNPISSLLRYYYRLKDQLVWGTDEPWSPDYFGEVKILSSLPGNVIEQISIKNPKTFLFE